MRKNPNKARIVFIFPFTQGSADRDRLERLHLPSSWPANSRFWKNSQRLLPGAKRVITFIFNESRYDLDFALPLPGRNDRWEGWTSTKVRYKFDRTNLYPPSSRELWGSIVAHGRPSWPWQRFFLSLQSSPRKKRDLQREVICNIRPGTSSTCTSGPGDETVGTTLPERRS